MIIRTTTILLLASLWATLAGAAGRHGVYKSTDQGKSWVRTAEVIGDGSRVNAFGSVEATLLAGTDSGLFLSRDQARTWQAATGVAMSSGRILSFATVAGKVLASTDGRGLLVSVDQGDSWSVHTGLPSTKVRCLLAHEGNVYAGTEADG